MNVLHVLPSLAARTGGPAVSTVEMVRVLKARGIQASIYTTDLACPPQSRRRRFGVGLEDLPSGAETLDIEFFPVRPPTRLVYSPELRKALALNVGNFDIVHIHSLFLYPQFAAFREARRAGVPHLVSLHGALDPYLRRRGRLRKLIVDRLWQRGMLNSSASLHFTSDEERRQIVDLGLLPPTHVGPYGVRNEAFDPLPSPKVFRERFLNGFEGPLFLYHGRITPKKGLDVLIEAFAGLRKRDRRARLAIVGPDDEGLGAQLRVKAQELKVGDFITFVRMLQGQDLRAALAAADVWVMPSRGENFAVAAVEALAAGLPVIVSKHVNISPEIVQAGAGIAPDLAPDAFAEAMLHLISDSKTRAAMSRRAHTLAKKFDWSVVGDQLEQMYVRILKNCTRAPRTELAVD